MPSPLCRILSVEDEPDIRVVAQMALEAVGGFSVIVCASGQEALSAMAMKEDQAKTRAAGCDAYIAKPLRCRELYAAIDSLLVQEGPRASSPTNLPDWPT